MNWYFGRCRGLVSRGTSYGKEKWKIITTQTAHPEAAWTVKIPSTASMPPARGEDLLLPAAAAISVPSLPPHRYRDDQPSPLPPRCCRLYSLQRHAPLCFALVVDSGHQRSQGGIGNPMESRQRSSSACSSQARAPEDREDGGHLHGRTRAAA
jgi:hypothetical protein